MKINEMIRELRIKKGLTQEQMASLLGVSAPAVNKWEKAVSYPDITLLPALARLLETDLNTLLSFKEEPTKEEIIDFLNELAADVSSNGAEHAFHMGMEKVREYPSCDPLILNIAVTLEGILGIYSKEDCTDLKNDIEKLYERASQSTDTEVRDRARALLIFKYIDREEYNRAEIFLKELPEESMMDKNQIRTRLYMKQKQWEDAGRVLESRLLMRLNDIQAALMDLMTIAFEENRPKDAEEIADISRQAVRLFGLWDYGSYSAQFQLAFARKDTGQCITILRDMFPAILKNWEPGQSPLYRYTGSKSSTDHLGKSIFPKILSEFEDPENEEFHFLQDEPEFRQLISAWKEKI